MQIVLAKPRWRGHLATAEAPAHPSVVSGGERMRRAAASPSSACASPTARRCSPRRTRSRKSWLGPAVERRRQGRAARRSAGREIAHPRLGIAAALRRRRCGRGWSSSIAGDLNDIAATFAGRSGLPDGAAGEDRGRRRRLGRADAPRVLAGAR